jgi:hypothetical protein
MEKPLDSQALNFFLNLVSSFSPPVKLSLDSKAPPNVWAFFTK